MAMVVCNGHLEEPIEVQGIVASCMESLPWQRDRCSSGVNRQTFDCTLPEPQEGTWRYLHGRHNIESPARSRCSVSHRNKVDGPPSQNDRPTTDKRSPATAAAAAVGTAQRRVQLRAATLEPSCWHARIHGKAGRVVAVGREAISAPATPADPRYYLLLIGFPRCRRILRRFAPSARAPRRGAWRPIHSPRGYCLAPYF